MSSEASQQGAGSRWTGAGAPLPGAGDEGRPDPAGLGFHPCNELERVLLRSVFSGARGTLLRALARSTLCVPGADPAGRDAGTEAGSGLQVPCVADAEGRHALVYTSYRQLALARRAGADRRWFEVPTATLLAGWPAEVDVWLNVGGELGFPLDADDLVAVVDLADGREIGEAYEIGPDDVVTDYPGPSVPDAVDRAVLLALLEVPAVLEVLRTFRRLEEPGGRTWRVLLVLVDAELGRDGQRSLARSVAEAVNAAADECCEVHVADVHDDEVFDAMSPLLHAGVPLWRREVAGDPAGDGPTDPFAAG